MKQTDMFPKADQDSSNTSADMFPNLARPTQNNERLPPRRTPWSAASPPPPQRSRTPSPPDISLEVPASYRQRRPQEPDYLPVTDSWLFRGIKTRVGDLALADIVAVAEDVAAPRSGRAEVLCEYTWVETGERSGGGAAWPALYVPGNAPVWRGVLRGRGLGQVRSALSVRDEHAQRQPLFPYEPTFRALEEAQAQAQAQSPEAAEQPFSGLINFRTVEVVSDASTLAQLFAFISTPYPNKSAPFRLELSMVRSTLFVSKAEHPRRGHKAKSGRVPTTMPDWASDAVLSLGTRDAHAPFSGGHWRVLRYRLGTMLCVVRAKVDFVYENCQTTGGTAADPLKGVRPEMVKGNEENGGIDTWKTTVKNVGRGTQAGVPGLVTVRYHSDDAKEKLSRNMPAIWFGRVPFVIDAAVSSKLEVKDASLLSVHADYSMWEKQHQASLKRMAGLFKRLKYVTRALGGSCVIVADPRQRCFTVMKPVIKRAQVPEEVAVRFWGEEDEAAETEYESTVASEVSELSSLSRTPSGFEDWGVESQMEESSKRRPRPDIRHRPSERPRINPMGLVTGWLNRETEDPGHDLSYNLNGGDGETDHEDWGPVRQRDSSISRLGLALDNAHSGFRLGYDGTIECAGDIDMEDGESRNEDEDEREDGEEPGEESGLDRAGGMLPGL